MLKLWIFEKKYKWKYTLDKELRVYNVNYKGLFFDNPFIKIEDGIIIVKEGYSWNGCTGVTDGKKDECKKASCFHDALYQFKIGKREDADMLFYILLKEANWKYSKLYYKGVIVFGLLYWNF